MTEKLTKALIDSTPFSTTGQYTLMDSQTPGFGLRVGAQSKTFIVVKRLPHKAPQRVTLGKYGALTVDTARKLAIEALAKLSGGTDINAQKKVIKAEQNALEEEKRTEQEQSEQTLSWLLKEYKDNQLIKSKDKVSQSTLSSFEYCFQMFDKRKCQTLKYNEKKKCWEEAQIVELNSWLERPLRSIEPKEILARFETMEITKPQKLLGGKLAPMVRTHQLTFKFAQCAYEWFIPRNYHSTDKQEILENPFKILNVFKKWKKTGVRTRIVNYQDKDEFGKWWCALQKYRSTNEVATDYIEFSLLQAGRSIELVPLKWEQVDMKRGVVVYEKTKNGLDYVVPLSQRAKEILERRMKANPKGNSWVWHYPSSATGHVPKDMKHHFQQIAELGAKYVSSHDLKRTWASAANSIADIKEREINYLLKHKENDVNKHYFVKNETVLRSILQRVENVFLERAKEFEETQK